MSDKRQCPACSSPKLTRLSRTWVDRLISPFAGSRKYRCLLCGHQFYVRHHEPDAPSET